MHVGESAENGWMDGEPGRRRVRILELDLQYIKQSYMKISAQYVKRTQEKSAENCVFPVFLVQKRTLLLQKLTEIDDTRSWPVVQ